MKNPALWGCAHFHWRCWHSCGHVNSFFMELDQHLHCSPWVFVPPTWQHRLFPCLLCFGRIQIVFLSLALQNKKCPGYLHRLCSVWSAFLCAINTRCINFEMSLLISSSSNVRCPASQSLTFSCYHLLNQVWLLFTVFLLFPQCRVCRKLLISFVSFSSLRGSANISSILIHINCSFVHFVRALRCCLWETCGFMWLTKLCFVLP